jgi:hypothetical protein
MNRNESFRFSPSFQNYEILSIRHSKILQLNFPWKELSLERKKLSPLINAE